jgi:hypothetical protein
LSTERSGLLGASARAGAATKGRELSPRAAIAAIVSAGVRSYSQV